MNIGMGVEGNQRCGENGTSNFAEQRQLRELGIEPTPGYWPGFWR
jgi:hypothetical protein